MAQHIAVDLERDVRHVRLERPHARAGDGLDEEGTADKWVVIARRSFLRSGECAERSHGFAGCDLNQIWFRLKLSGFAVATGTNWVQVDAWRGVRVSYDVRQEITGGEADKTRRSPRRENQPKESTDCAVRRLAACSP